MLYKAHAQGGSEWGLTLARLARPLGLKERMKWEHGVTSRSEMMMRETGFQAWGKQKTYQQLKTL